MASLGLSSWVKNPFWGRRGSFGLSHPEAPCLPAQDRSPVEPQVKMSQLLTPAPALHQSSSRPYQLQAQAEGKKMNNFLPDLVGVSAEKKAEEGMKMLQCSPQHGAQHCREELHHRS